MTQITLATPATATAPMAVIRSARMRPTAQSARHVGIDEIGYSVVGPALGEIVLHARPPIPSAFEQTQQQASR